jgi:hypothetical protein
MKIVINKVKIGQRARIANTASVGGLALLLSSVVVPLFVPKMSQTLALILILAGIVTAMVGIYLANRWVRRPRPEEVLSKALKGLDDKYALYNYPALPCDHLLLTPNGVVVLETVNLPGEFIYKNGRWSEKMSVGRALRYIVEERLGDPTRSALAVKEYLADKLTKAVSSVVPVQPLIVFTHPAAELDLEAGPVPVYIAEKLKKHVTINAPRLAPEAYQEIARFLEKMTLGK